MRSAISDEMLERLVPTGTYAEIPDLLIDWYGGLATGITVSMPEDPSHDGGIAELIRALRER